MIRTAVAADAALLAALGERTFRDTFAPDNTAADMDAYCASAFGERKQAFEIAHPRARFLIDERDGVAAGYVRLVRGPAPPFVRAARPLALERLYVDRPWLGKGVGAALMQTCLDEAARDAADVLWLAVWTQNHRARAFYDRWRFVPVGEQTFVLGTDLQHDLVLAREVR